MDNLNYVFFEEFKHLDKLCGELYGDPHGVSKYINDMKNMPQNDCWNIPNWKTDLELLIRLRHIRNNLAHTEGAFHEEMCTQKDIDWVRDFHRRILNQSDPLAMLYQYSKTKQQMTRVRKQSLQQLSTQSFGYSTKFIIDGEATDVKKSAGMRVLHWIVLFLILIVTALFVLFSIMALLV